MSQSKSGLVVPSVIRAVEKLDDSTVYRFVGMPYQGPIEGIFDLHGTYFAPETYLGPTNRELPVFFEHGTFPEIEFAQMGVARIAQEDLMGRIFDVVVQKANEYHDFLQRLYEEGLLFGSAQAFVSGYNVDPETGKLLKFVPAEYSFTVRPSNVLARPIEVIRSVFTDTTKVNSESVERYYSMETLISPDVNTENPQTPVSLTERVQEALAQTTAAEAPVELALDNEVLRATVLTLRNQQADIQAIRSELARTSEDISTVVNFEERFKSIEEAIVLLAEKISADTQRIATDVQRIMANATLNTLLEASTDEIAQVKRSVNSGFTPVQSRTNAAASNIPTISIRPPGMSGFGG